MDKQLIEQIAEAAYEDAMGQSLRPKDRREVVRVCVAFLARIDAERGKVAVAWVDTLDTARPRCITNLDYRSVTEAKLGVEYVPLFISPTIPEGMALVRIEPTQAMIAAGINTPLIDTGDDTVDQQADYRAVWKSMIAAAQGERNATD